jgi:hypothetical protein
LSDGSVSNWCHKINVLCTRSCLWPVFQGAFWVHWIGKSHPSWLAEGPTLQLFAPHPPLPFLRFLSAVSACGFSVFGAWAVSVHSVSISGVPSLPLGLPFPIQPQGTNSFVSVSLGSSAEALSAQVRLRDEIQFRSAIWCSSTWRRAEVPLLRSRLRFPERMQLGRNSEQVAERLLLLHGPRLHFNAGTWACIGVDFGWRDTPPTDFALSVTSDAVDK